MEKKKTFLIIFIISYDTQSFGLPEYSRDKNWIDILVAASGPMIDVPH